MKDQFHIKIDGFSNPEEFVTYWSKTYSFSNEKRYTNNIDSVLDSKESFIELFKWKNGTGNTIYYKKMDVVLRFWKKIDVLRTLCSEFDWELFETTFEPQKNSTIWKLFLLHLVDRKRFPIFDQHVFRSYNFIQNGVIEEIPNNSKKKFEIYKNQYLSWFTEIQRNYNLSPKKMDESFFSFGQMLKSVKKYPLKINN